jgi:glutamate-1-semialdehyde 2,1-aminomutase
LTNPHRSKVSVVGYAGCFATHGGNIAAVLVEPVAGNMNCVLPQPGFLSGLRSLCDQHRACLIFDEVMTGFRVALGGAQSVFQVTPDLTVLGKIIGGGLPMGAFGGKAELMAHLSPLGNVYQAGTLSGNPIAVAAGLATLELCQADGFYARLREKNAALQAEVNAVARAAGIPFLTHHLGGMFGWFFTNQKQIISESCVQCCELKTFPAFFHAMLQQGIYLAPSPFEAGFISQAHTHREIQHTAAAFAKALEASLCHTVTP